MGRRLRLSRSFDQWKATKGVSDCSDLSSHAMAIRWREGTDPWPVGTTTARPSGPLREIPDGPFLCYDACSVAHFASAPTLVLGRLRLAGAYCACRTAIGRTSNKSAAAKLGPVIVLPTVSTVRIAEKLSTNTDAFQA